MSVKKYLVNVGQKTSMIDMGRKIVSTNVSQKLASIELNQKQPRRSFCLGYYYFRKYFELFKIHYSLTKTN